VDVASTKDPPDYRRVELRVKISNDLAQRLADASRDLDTSRSDLVRLLLRKGLRDRAA
jgi:hypothetical protein